jgi:hypothetical protein
VQQPPREPPLLAVVSELAIEIAGFDGVADRLVMAHVDDGRGYCSGCWFPQTPAPVWPCTLHAIGRQARELDRARRLPRR